MIMIVGYATIILNIFLFYLTLNLKILKIDES